MSCGCSNSNGAIPTPVAGGGLLETPGLNDAGVLSGDSLQSLNDWLASKGICGKCLIVWLVIIGGIFFIASLRKRG